MWYIKRRDSKERQYLSIYSGWRKKAKVLTVRDKCSGNSLIKQWIAELKSFPTQKEADAYIQANKLNAVSVNALL